MRAVTSFIISVACLFALFSCGGSSGTSTKELTEFSFEASHNSNLTTDVAATINGSSIAATVPFGTDVTHLVATFVSTGETVKVGSVAQIGGQSPNDFTNPVTYQVVAGDGSTQDYSVEVTVAKSSAKELTAFSFQMAHNAGLTADVTATINGDTISATLPFGVNVSALVATFTTTGASVTASGTTQVSGVTPNDFANYIMYTVNAADGSTRVYTVMISSAPSTAKDLTSFKFLSASNAGLPADVTGTINGTNVAATVPFGTNLTALKATFTRTGVDVSVAGVAQLSGITANNFTSPVVYRVTAADGSTKDYTVTVTVAANSAKDLTSFKFLSANNGGLPADVTATINGTAIAATVPFGSTVTALVATFATTGASVKVGTTIQVSGTTANNFTSAVTYTVTAADATTKAYTVTVTVAANPAKDLTSFKFLSAINGGLPGDVTATLNVTAIAATVPFGTDVTALVATFATTGASVKVGGTVQASGITANNFTSPVTYTVTAADGSTKDYTVTVTIAASPAKDITSFAFLSAGNGLPADVTSTITGTAIDLTVPYGTNVTALIATFSHSGASVKVGGTAQTSGTTANNFTSPVVYRVTAADSTTKDYTVTVTIAPGTAKDLTSFKFLSATNAGLPADVTGTFTGTSIAVTVPFGTNVTALVATFATTGASVKIGTTAQTSGITPNDFTAVLTYTVTAADASTQNYTVTVTIAKNTAKDLSSFVFLDTDNAALAADVTATISGTNIAATVPFGTNVTALIATFATTGASVKVGANAQASGITPNDFTNPVTYTVTADDASTKDYIVTVTIAPPPPKDLTAFSFDKANNAGLTADVIGTITGTSIAVTVPFGTTVTALVATFTTNGASVSVGGTAQVSGTTPNDFTNPVTYTVTATDTTTQDYTVTVTAACQTLTDPANGSVSVSNGGLYPSTATYSCSGGFALGGDVRRACVSDHTWSGYAPTCTTPSIMVVRVGDGAAALTSTSTPVFIETRSVTGSVMQTIALPSGTTTPFTTSGSASSEGGLSRSADGRYVTLAGYAAAAGTPAIAATQNNNATGATNRAVARIDAAGNYDTSTLLFNAFSSSNPRGATTVDGSGFWVSGSTGTTGGVYYVAFGSTGAVNHVVSSPNNTRCANIFGAQLYVTSSSGTFLGVNAVGTGTPTTTGITPTTIASSPSAYGFALLDLSPVTVGPDTMYVADDSSIATADAVGILKFTFDGTTWAQDSTFKPTISPATGVGTGFGTRGLAAWLEGSAVHVVATTSETTNRIVSFVDDGSTATPAVTPLATATTNTVFRGIALTPAP